MKSCIIHSLHRRVYPLSFPNCIALYKGLNCLHDKKEISRSVSSCEISFRIHRMFHKDERTSWIFQVLSDMLLQLFLKLTGMLHHVMIFHISAYEHLIIHLDILIPILQLNT